MTYICRWCENNFEEPDNHEIEATYKGGVLCCPRCGNITYGFLVVDGKSPQYHIDIYP